MKKVKELGLLPMDAKQYESLPMKLLDRKLNETLENLKKYKNVNKKALDQFVQASSQEEDLAKRMEEPMNRANEKSINNIENINNTKLYSKINIIILYLLYYIYIIIRKCSVYCKTKTFKCRIAELAII